MDGAGACDYAVMSTFNRIRRTLSGLAAETRPEFKRIDASSARYDDGSWLKA